MTVRINRLDPWAVGCPPRDAQRGQVKDFGAKFTDFHCTRVSRQFGRSVLVLSLNLVGPTDHITKIQKICRKTAVYY